ncbi:nucleotide-binding protein [Nocardiopsis oceani]
MRLSIAFANTKPGTSKTTSSVLLAYALHTQGHRVLLADVDPAGSALAWSDAVGGFPFDVVGLPRTNPGGRLADYATGETIAIVDTPQAEDHGREVRSVLRVADEIVIPVAPSTIEMERTSAMTEVLEEAHETRSTPARVAVLLTRVVANANSGGQARDALTAAGHEVLATEVPRREFYALAYGQSPTPAGLAPFEDLSKELLTRAGIA